jgi:hypothetical protein
MMVKRVTDVVPTNLLGFLRRWGGGANRLYREANFEVREFAPLLDLFRHIPFIPRTEKRPARTDCLAAGQFEGRSRAVELGVGIDHPPGESLVEEVNPLDLGSRT